MPNKSKPLLKVSNQSSRESKSSWYCVVSSEAMVLSSRSSKVSARFSPNSTLPPALGSEPITAEPSGCIKTSVSTPFCRGSCIISNSISWSLPGIMFKGDFSIAISANFTLYFINNKPIDAGRNSLRPHSRYSTLRTHPLESELGRGL